VPSFSIGKLAAGLAGVAGTGGFGAAAFAVGRVATCHVVPVELWAVPVSSVAAIALITSFSLVLDYKLKKLMVQSQSRQAAAATELQKERLAIHRTVLEKAAGDPASIASYRELIVADSLHLSVEHNGSQPADRTRPHYMGQHPAVQP
jgi:hypothetical protein